MNIRYPVEINLHGELVDQNGIVLARDVVEGSLGDFITDLMTNKKKDLIR